MMIYGRHKMYMIYIDVWLSSVIKRSSEAGKILEDLLKKHCIFCGNFEAASRNSKLNTGNGVPKVSHLASLNAKITKARFQDFQSSLQHPQITTNRMFPLARSLGKRKFNFIMIIMNTIQCFKHVL